MKTEQRDHNTNASIPRDPLTDAERKMMERGGDENCMKH